jgi:hypothetical protein
VVIRRALALLGLGALLACNAIIGLEQPTVDAGDDAALEADAAPEAGEQPDAAQATDAASEKSVQGDGASLADMTSPPFDASDARDSTVSDDAGSPTQGETGPSGGGDATLAGPALLYVVNAAQLPGIVICVGIGQAGSAPTVQTGPPWPQHSLSQSCVPLTCADQNIHCGPAADGCGGLLDCGMCASPETCGGGGVPGQCGGLPEGGVCQPLDCTQQGVSCGPVGDGCGNLLACGPCPPPQTCINGGCAIAATGGGLLPGTGQPGPAMDGFANDFTTAFLIPASSVQPGQTCPSLIGATGAGGLLSQDEFFQVGSAPMGTFAPGTTTLVVYWGCPPGLADGGMCGMGYDPDAGNLSAIVRSLPRLATVGPSAIGMFGANAAPALDCLNPGCPPMMPQLVLSLPNGNTFPMPPMPVGVTPPGPVTVNGFQQDASGASLMDPMFPWQASFDDIARDSNDGSTTTPDGGPYFSNGQDYFLVLVGNPLISPDASANEAFHIIGAPFSFQPDTMP